MIIPEKDEITLKNLVGDTQFIVVTVIDNKTDLPLSSIPLESIFNDKIWKQTICGHSSKF